MTDPIVARLRAGGCVFAEDEAAFIRRHLAGDAVDLAVAARVDGQPLEQAVGVAEFGGVVVRVADGVFVPRSRAEAIIDTALAEQPDAKIVVDLGCGCGALAAALTARLPRADVHAADLDPTAIDLARINGEQFEFTVHEGSWWDALPAELAGRIDLAVAYLPHVPSGRVEGIHPDFRAHEPLTTVDGGQDGLDHLRAVLSGLAKWLTPTGAFVTLVGSEQADGLPGRALSVDDDSILVVRPRDL